MDYTLVAPPPVAMSEGELTDRVAVISLYEGLQRLPDPRRGQGKRYELARLFCRLLLANLAGQPTLRGATAWIGHRADKIADYFGRTRKQMPCQMTYCRILARVAAQALDELLAGFFTRWEAPQRCENDPSRRLRPQGHLDHAQLAIDGKTRRSTSTQAHPVHQLSGDDVTTGTVRWQRHVGEKQNEISALKPLSTASLVKGRIVTLDAMPTQRDRCAQIQRLGGAYVLEASDHQPTLVEDIADLFADRAPDRRRWMQAETWDKGHGRLEQRQIPCSPDRNRVGWQAVARH